jgi:3-hydroxypropanoate dehydrogenase
MNVNSSRDQIWLCAVMRSPRQRAQKNAMEMMIPQIDAQLAVDVFEEARTHSSWLDRPVPDELLVKLYERLRWAPTSINSNPGRFVFVRTPESKKRLASHLLPMNVEKTMAAPVSVIVARDTRFHELMPELFPGRPVKAGLDANSALVEATAIRNATLQGAYLILAARSLGLDCGPMSGFNSTTLDADFFPDGRWKSDFLVNIGYGDMTKVWPRNPRLEFGQACIIC